MNVFMFSMTPLFANKSMGGAQKQLKKVALHLAEQGHQVMIACTWRQDAAQPFAWHERAQVMPLYRFKQPFPEPYETPLYHIANAIRDTAEYLRQADAFYNHDGGLIFPFIGQDVPTTVSLRSVLFSETLQSGFLFAGDSLILPSQHTAACWLETKGQVFPGFAERVRVIPNGLDFASYRPTPPDALAALIPDFDPVRCAYLLYPHRPETPKGIEQAILLTEKLVQGYGLAQVRLLVPRWIDVGLAEHVRAYYEGLARDIAARGLSEHVVFHDWISDDLMPAYYSAGALALVLGHYVETFGNTPYEALACGTLPLVARVGAYRGMLEGRAPMIDYGDLDEAAALAAAIVTERQRTPAATLAWLQAGFQQADMVRAYEEVILGTRKQAPLAYEPGALEAVQAWRLPTWCYFAGERLWHDFLGAYLHEPELQTLTQAGQVAFAADKAAPPQLAAWRREGLIVPAW